MHVLNLVGRRWDKKREEERERDPGCNG